VVEVWQGLIGRRLEKEEEKEGFTKALNQ